MPVLTNLSRLRCKCTAAVLLLFLGAGVGAAPLTPQARAAIESFLLAQARGPAGSVTVRLDDPSGELPPCAGPQPFLPQGVAAWGRFSVGVRCPGERPWTRFLPAQVSVEGTYLAAAHPIQPGQTLIDEDVVARRGDLTKLPRTVLTSASQVFGMVATNAIAADAPLRADLLRGAMVIQQGQLVRLVAEGDGYVISTEGKATMSAAAGATLQVRTADGRLLAAVARKDGHASIGN